MSTNPDRKPRMILNDDGSNFLYAWDDLGVEDLKTYLARLQGTQVDMVAYCVAFGGWLTYYDSSIAEPIGTGFSVTERVRDKRFFWNRSRLQVEGGDYIGCVLAILREMGIEMLASIRMNDAHMSSDPTGLSAGRFWMNHPQWRLGEPYGYYASCLDYAAPPVREHLRLLANEVIEKFPNVCGIELDGMRSPFFFRHGTGGANARLMTSLIRDIRNDLNQRAVARGRGKYWLWVNVPRSPALALDVGMDVAAWDAEKLVDGIACGCYGTDFQLPIEEWKTVLRNDTLVYAYINCGRVGSQYHSLEEYRGAAANAYAAGADGIYLFNFPCLDELSSLLPRPISQPPFPPPDFGPLCWHPDLKRTRRALCELGDPNLLKRRNKKFLFCTAPPTYHHEVPEAATIARLSPQPAEIHFACFEELENAVEARLEFKLVGVSVHDRFDFRLNDTPVSESQTQRLHTPGGRDQRIHGTALEPYSLFVIEPRGLLYRGCNSLQIRLADGDPHLLGRIEVREVELSIYYDKENTTS